ncbi:MAG: cysteine-rich VLP protein [Clostridium sp.]|nr:cysteine-rich VLP protein [Clostridium sp.]
MSKRPYQHLPPLEHRPDGSPYRITPPQKRRASGLIRRECCNCEDGNCLALDDGDTCACPQMISFRDKDLKRCEVCGGVFVPKSNRAKYCPGCAARVHRRQKTESERKRRSAVDS